jgi:DNA-binding GntR family transcriptional regulator
MIIMIKTKDEVAKLIRQGIMNNEFHPNERLVETSLAKMYGVSRSTIRLSLADLENERLIEKEPNRGARVRNISLQEAIEITEVRYVIEPLLAQKAAENITVTEIKELEQILREMKEAYNQMDFTQYSRVNKRLHNKVYQVARHVTGSRILTNLRAQSVRYQFKLSLMPIRINSSVIEHQNIVNSIIGRDPDLAKKSMEEHIKNMLDTYRDLPKESFF